MNIVQLYILDYDGSIISEYLFHTNKEKKFFCLLDNIISQEFLDWLRENRNSIFNEIGNHEITIFYYHNDSIDNI